MAFSSELLKKFNEDGVPLGNRLIAAKKLFMRSEFSFISRKEELVLDWLIQLSQEDCREDIWYTLRDCLGSQNMKNLNAFDIQTLTKEMLVELIIKSLDPETTETCIKRKRRKKDATSCGSAVNIVENFLVRECANLTLETDVFVCYFRRDLDKFVKMSILLLKSASEENDIEAVFRYLKSLVKFYAQGTMERDIFRAFVEGLLLPIIDVYLSVKNSELIVDDENTSLRSHGSFRDKRNDNLKNEIILLIRDIVFPVAFLQKIKRSCFTIFKYNVMDMWTLCILFEFLVRRASSYPNKTTFCLYSFVFEAFGLCISHDFPCMYQFFVIMCLLLGFEPEIKRREEDRARFLLVRDKVFKVISATSFETNQEFSCSVLVELISYLQKSTVDLYWTMKDVSFKEWMQSLIVSLISSRPSVAIYNVLNSVMELNPLIIEPVTIYIFQRFILWRKKTDEEKEAYKKCMKGILDMSIKCNRLTSLFEMYLFPILEEEIVEHRLNNRVEKLKIPVGEVLPEGFSAMLGNAVGVLSGQMCISLMEEFLTILNEKVIQPAEEGEFDDEQILYLGIVENLLFYYLGGVRMAEQNILEPICNQFTKCLINLRELMGRLCNVLTKNNADPNCWECFLRLSLAVGDVQLLLLLYSPWSSQHEALQLASQSDPECAMDLHCLHSFLSSAEWKEVAVGVCKLQNERCHNAMNALVHQKLRVLRLFGEKIDNSEKMQMSVCKILTTSLKSLIFEKSADTNMLLSLLPREDLLLMAKHTVAVSVATTISSNTLNYLRNPELNVHFITSLGWVTLQNVGRVLKEGKKSDCSEHLELDSTHFVDDDLSHLDMWGLLSAQSKQEVKLAKEGLSQAAKKLNSRCVNVLEKGGNGDNHVPIDFSAVLKYLAFIKNLPLPFFCEKLQTAFSLGIVAILLVMEESSNSVEVLEVHQQDQKKIAVKNICMEILQGLLEESNSNALELLDVGHLVRLLHRDGQSSLSLLRLVFETCVEKRYNIKGLADATCLADDFVEENISKSILPISSILLKVLSKRTKVNIYKEVINVLISSLSKHIKLKMMSQEFSEGSLLLLFDTICGLFFFPSVEVSNLTPHLDSLVSCALSVIENKDSSPEHILTAEQLLEAILSRRKEIGEDVFSNIIMKSYKLIRKPSFFEKILSHSPGDFDIVVEDICMQLTKKFPDLSLLKTLLNSITMKSDEYRIDVMLEKVGAAAFEMILNREFNEHLAEFVDFLVLALQFPKIPYTLGDVSITSVMCAVEMPSTSLEFVVPIILNVITVMQLLLIKHMPLVEDRVPAFLLAVRSTMHIIVANSSVHLNHGPQGVKNLATCGLRFEQLSRYISSNSTYFKSQSHFIMADLLLELQEATIYPEVKMHINNALYCFVSVCNGPATSHLLMALPPASLELFKTILNTYNQYYHTYI